MQPQWQVFDPKNPESFPAAGEEIYISITEGHDEPFVHPRQMTADCAALSDLLTVCPDMTIIWRPVPPPPPAPSRPPSVRT